MGEVTPHAMVALIVLVTVSIPLVFYRWHWLGGAAPPARRRGRQDGTS